MSLKDWEEIAHIVGCDKDEGIIVTSDMAKNAISLLLGEDFLKEAVYHYVEFRPRAELVRSVLKVLKPKISIRECSKVFKESNDLSKRINAIELLSSIANQNSILQVANFLQDDSPEIQFYGFMIVVNLVYDGVVEYQDISFLLDLGKKHENPLVKEKAEEIEVFFK